MKITTEELKLSGADLWKRLTEDCEARLAELRQQNDASMTEADRNQLIGKIAECKRFLQMDKEEPQVLDDTYNAV